MGASVHISKADKDFKEAIPDYLINLDLGSGHSPLLGYKSVDISPDVGADYVVDLDKYPWPFEKHSVFKIHTSHFIEHIADIKKFMEECYRVMVPLGIMTIRAPYWSSMRAWQDFTHVREISENTFLYFNQDWMKANKLEHYGVNCNFNIVDIKFFFTQEWAVKSDAAREFAKKHYIGCIDDIEVILQKQRMK